MDRSANMRAIRNKGMKPELAVRSLVHRLGFRYRLHRKDLPGKPDLVFGPRRKVIFVHGCFWHGCPRCNYPLPKNNTEFWQAKFTRNTTRDAQKKADLKHLGWKVITALHSDCF